MVSSAKVYLAEYINLHEALYYCTVPCDAAVYSAGLPLVWLQTVAKGSAVERQRITEKDFFSSNEDCRYTRHINMADDLTEQVVKTVSKIQL